MKKLLFLFMTLLLTFTFSVSVHATGDVEATTEHPQTTEYPNDPSRAPDLVCQAAIIMDAGSGQVLYEKNAYEVNYPASITKVLTVLLALEHNLDFDETITISENAVWGVDRESSLIGLDVGEKITVRDMLNATMLHSDNTCAYTIAELVSGDLESFAQLMNKRAKELGCENTNFVTPNGLHDDNHYTCAYDMALIMKEALKHEEFRELAGTLSYVVPETNLADETRPLWNGNKMINPAESSYYEYCKGGKTGYTTVANNTLITYAEKENLELICVILNCDGWKYTYTDSKALYNYCYNNYTYFYPLSGFSFETDEENAIEKNTILTNYYSSLNHEMVDLVVDEKYSLLLNRSVDTTLIEQEIHLYDTAQDNILGEITFSYDGEQIGRTFITSTTPLLSSQITQEEEKKPSVWKTIGKIMLRILLVIAAIAIVLGLYMLFAALVRHVRRNNRRRGYRRRRRRRRDKFDDYYF